MQLKATRLDFRSEDASGYAFDVTAVRDPEFGWEASVSMTTHGMVSAEAAIERLRHACEAFLRKLSAGIEK